MDIAINQSIGVAGAVIALGLSAVGSAIGTGIAGGATVGAWKKCFAQGKQAPFLLLSFVGAPLTQTLYGLILMMVMQGRMTSGNAPSGIAMCLVGFFAGIGIALSAIFQGRVAGAAADAQAETGKGFTNYLSAIGIVETVAIFAMVFTLLIINKL